MSVIYFTENGEDKVAEIPFPEGKYNELLSKLFGKKKGTLDYKEKKKVFLLAVATFKSGALSLDELSEISCFMWSDLTGEEKAMADLGSVLYDCSEINYNARVSSGSVSQLLSKVHAYYEKHKSMLISTT